jgi:leucine dehydrogenase
MAADMINQEDFLDYALIHGFGDLHFKVDGATGMKAIIAVHNTKLGPAFGGCRFIEYPNTTSALYDAMRLARGMSYKSASVNLPFGGGKAVIIKPSIPYDRLGYMHAFGQFLSDLKGRYITALDSGTELSDMDVIAEHTPYVASLSKHNGDPAPYTAEGVLKGIEASVLFKLGKDKLSELHVAIQGLGHVGYDLAKRLYEMDVRLSVADVSNTHVERAVMEFGATPVLPEFIHSIPCDVFAPCALGAIINDTTIAQLQTSIIAGSANNQLAHTHHGRMLHERGILYAPDYVINAGGLIFAANQYLGTHQDVDQKLEQIGKSLLEIFSEAKEENRPTNEIADELAQKKLS